MSQNDFVIEYSSVRNHDDTADRPVRHLGILTEYHGPGGDLVIPEGVTMIRFGVFKNQLTIRSVVLPQTLTTICSEAFANCTGLESVTFPEALEEIDSSAFSNCTALKQILLPRKMKRIGSAAFYGCASVKIVDFPEELNRIGVNVFEGLHGLEEFRIPALSYPDNVLKFLSTYVLELDSLADYYLRGCIRTCPELEKAFFKRLNTKPKRKRFFSQYIKQHNASMVSNFLALIPKMSPEELDAHILDAESDPEIRTLFIDYQNKLYSASDLAQRESVQAEKDLGLRELTVSDWKKIYKINSAGHITGYKDTAPVAEIPYKVRNTVFQVGSNAFKHCGFLECVTIAEGVSLIDNSAFNGCVKLSQITIPSTLIKIGASAFKNCTALTDVHFPGAIANIGSKAFEGCTNLVIHAPAGSRILKYAEKNGIAFVAE